MKFEKSGIPKRRKAGKKGRVFLLQKSSFYTDRSPKVAAPLPKKLQARSVVSFTQPPALNANSVGPADVNHQGPPKSTSSQRKCHHLGISPPCSLMRQSLTSKVDSKHNSDLIPRRVQTLTGRPEYYIAARSYDGPQLCELAQSLIALMTAILLGIDLCHLYPEFSFHLWQVHRSRAYSRFVPSMAMSTDW